jgi:hypothetical protein
VRQLAYQALGFVVWKGVWAYLHQRYAEAPRKIALGGLLVAVVAALVLAARKAASE